MKFWMPKKGYCVVCGKKGSTINPNYCLYHLEQFERGYEQYFKDKEKRRKKRLKKVI